MTDPKKTPTRRIRRVRPEQQQPVAKIERTSPRRRVSAAEEIVVVDRNDPRRERD